VGERPVASGQAREIGLAGPAIAGRAAAAGLANLIEADFRVTVTLIGMTDGAEQQRHSSDRRLFGGNKKVTIDPKSQFIEHIYSVTNPIKPHEAEAISAILGFKYGQHLWRVRKKSLLLWMPSRIVGPGLLPVIASAAHS